MNPTALFAITLVSVCGVTLAAPSLSPARFLFGVRVGAPFRKTGPGREALRIYYAHDVTGIAIAIALVFALGLHREWTWMLAVLLAEAAAVLGYYRAHRRLRPFAAPADLTAVREADLFAAEDRLPRWTLWAIPPFLLPITGAAYLHAHWSEIPARIPVHFTLSGHPDRWVDKTPGAVYGMAAANAGVLLFTLLLGLAVYYGARRSPQRVWLVKFAVAMMYFISAMFTASTLIPVVGYSPLWFLIPIPLFVVFVLVWAYKTVRDPRMPSEETPDACWRGGFIYYNPEDPAAFVQKRVGFGYTLNFGNRMVWVIAGVVLAVVFAATVWL
jgi:uncharacterized membrane protein